MVVEYSFCKDESLYGTVLGSFGSFIKKEDGFCSNPDINKI